MGTESREMQICRTLIQVSDWLRDSATPRDSSTEYLGNLSLRHLDVLRIVWSLLEEKPDGITLKRLAEELKLTPGTVSGLVDTLVRKNVLCRVQSQEDRREVKITLAPESRQMIDRITGRMNEIALKLFSCLEQKEKDAIGSGLDKLNRKIKQLKKDKE